MVINGGIAQSETNVEPAFWRSGMQNSELQLKVHGEDIASYKLNIVFPGLKILDIISLDNPNYVFIYVDLFGAKPGRFDITFTKGRKKIV
jgi:neopullulanase